MKIASQNWGVQMKELLLEMYRKSDDCKGIIKQIGGFERGSDKIIEAAEEREPPLGKGSPKRETQADKRAKSDGKIKDTPGLR